MKTNEFANGKAGLIDKHFGKIKAKYGNAKDMSPEQSSEMITESLSAWEFSETWSEIGKVDTNSNIPSLLDMFKRKDEFRVVELDEKVMPLIETTDNEVFYRNCPFDCCFINNKFRFKDYIVLGVFVFNYSRYSDFIKTSIGIEEDIGILFLSYRLGDEGEYFHYYYLVDGCLVEDELKETLSKKEQKKVEALRSYVGNIVCNFIDFVTTEKEYDLIEKPKDDLLNKKRIRRGKSPHPNRVYIRLNGKLKERADAFQKGMLKYSHRFLVRGFWRHYRNSRYINMQGKKQWVYPFWKGQGEIAKPQYKVKE